MTHPTVTGAVGSALGHATTFQLHLTQIISIEPGQGAQCIHRDQWAFDFFSFPNGYEVTCNTIWAMTDFTEANGATRRHPGEPPLRGQAPLHRSRHRAGRDAQGLGAPLHRRALPRRRSQLVGRHPPRCEHHVRVGWLRQEENQYLSVPAEIARDLPDDLLRLIGLRARRLRARLRRRPARPDRRAAGRRAAIELRTAGCHPPTLSQRDARLGPRHPGRARADRRRVAAPRRRGARVRSPARRASRRDGDHAVRRRTVDLPRPADALGPDRGLRPGRRRSGRAREEDRAALAVLGATPVWLDFVEHQYLDRPDWVGADQTVDTLEAAIRAADPTAVFMPFGLANPDHTATHDAARLVRDRIPELPWLCYEDMGYKHIPGLLAWRVAQLFRAEVWPTPVAPPVAADGDAPSRGLRALRVAGPRPGGGLAARAPSSPPPPPSSSGASRRPRPGWERLSQSSEPAYALLHRSCNPGG